MGLAEVVGRTLVSFGFLALPVTSMIFLPQAFGWTIFTVLLVPAIWNWRIN